MPLVIMGDIFNFKFSETFEIAKSSVIISPFISMASAIIDMSCFESWVKSPEFFAALVADLIASAVGSLIFNRLVSSSVPRAL